MLLLVVKAVGIEFETVAGESLRENLYGGGVSEILGRTYVTRIVEVCVCVCVCM